MISSLLWTAHRDIDWVIENNIPLTDIFPSDDWECFAKIYRPAGILQLFSMFFFSLVLKLVCGEDFH